MTMSPAARALIDAARDGLAPDASALRRVRGKIDSAVAGGAAGGAVAAKLTFVSVIALVVAGAFVLREREDVDAPALTFGATVQVEAPVQRVYEPPPPPRVEHIEMPAQRASRGVAKLPAPVVAEAPAIDLAREVELVDAAMSSLRSGDANGALASVRLHRVETNDRGQLAEDAAAIEIEALCRLRDRRVVPKLEAFDARWPESAQRSRLTTSCP